jgi:hypothetical protein
LGRAVESYRTALEGEIGRWKGFARALKVILKDELSVSFQVNKLVLRISPSTGTANETLRFVK